MNIPEIYLVEPYNAYAPKGRKKHWHEVVEEQALMARIVAEQMALQEAQTSKTLPPNSPATATPTVAGIPQAGGGGVPVYSFFHPEGDVANFSFTPSTGVSPFTVTFTNLTDTPEFDTYLWVFGDGTTSTDIKPVHVYQTGSTNPTYYTASLQVSHSADPSVTQSISKYITASVPTVTALFTYTTSSNVAPEVFTFTNGSSTNSQISPTLAYLWTFGDGVSSSLASPTHQYDTGSFTASMSVTGSYGIASKYTQSFTLPAPTLTVAFAVATSSTPAPVTASFTNTTAYNGAGTLTYKWVFGDGASSSVASPQHMYDTGSFTASLQVTESLYSIASKYTQSFFVPTPALAAAFTITTSSETAPSTTTFLNTTTYNGHGTLTYFWTLGSGSLSASTIIPNPQSYVNAGGYTASLQVTESNYNVTSIYAVSWSIA